MNNPHHHALKQAQSAQIAALRAELLASQEVIAKLRMKVAQGRVK